MTSIPEWMEGLEDEDLSFIKKFVLASGSLKEVASVYGVSYPTVRLRLDRLIQKIQLAESAEPDEYVALVKRLAAPDRGVSKDEGGTLRWRLRRERRRFWRW